MGGDYVALCFNSSVKKGKHYVRSLKKDFLTHEAEFFVINLDKLEQSHFSSQFFFLCVPDPRTALAQFQDLVDQIPELLILSLNHVSS